MQGGSCADAPKNHMSSAHARSAAPPTCLGCSKHVVPPTTQSSITHHNIGGLSEEPWQRPMFDFEAEERRSRRDATITSGAAPRGRVAFCWPCV